MIQIILRVIKRSINIKENTYQAFMITDTIVYEIKII